MGSLIVEAAPFTPDFGTSRARGLKQNGVSNSHITYAERFCRLQFTQAVMQ